MDGKLRVERLSIQSGNWQSQPGHLGVIDSAAHKARRGRGDLYFLLQTAHGKPLARPQCEELAKALSEAYYSVSGSVTRGLREALLAANALLFDQNLRTDSEHRLLIGLDVVVIRDEDVYIGQIGPALVSHIHEGVLARYPGESIWLRAEAPNAFEQNHEPPAGLRREVEPTLFHLTLAPGDVLILSTTDLAQVASGGDVVKATAQTAGSMATNLETLANGHDLSALLVEWPTANGPARPVQSAIGRSQPTEPPPVQAPVAETRPAEPARTTPRAEPKIEPRPTSRPASATVATVPSTTTSRPVSTPPPEPASEPEEDLNPWDEEEKEPERTAPTRPTRSTQAPQMPRVDLGEIKDNLSQGAERVRQGTEDFLLRVLPDRLPEAAPARPSDQSLSLSGKALVVVALAIPLMMLFLVVMARIQYERTRHDQFGSVQALAQSRFETAMSQGDPNSMRQGLQETMSTIEEGLAINPDDETLLSLRQRILFKQDDLDQVSRLYHFWQLVQLDDEPISPTDSSRIVIHGIDVFVLNRGSDRVYKYLLNDVGDALQSVEPNPVLLRKGDSVGGVQLGDLVDIAWLEAGGERSLSTFVALERAGSLLAYDPQQGVDVLPMADSDTWLKPQAIAGYFGNLYLLDPLLGRVLKFVPTDNAYTNPPADYLGQLVDLDLTGAVDMAIDGNLYILFADGQVKKFLKGDPQPFTMQGLPTPMRSPTSIFVSGAPSADGQGKGFVYVADAGNERIVQFDKSGNYIRQFRAKQGDTHLQALRGLYVDEERARLFILSGKTLWLTEIPSQNEGR